LFINFFLLIHVDIDPLKEAHLISYLHILRYTREHGAYMFYVDPDPLLIHLRDSFIRSRRRGRRRESHELRVLSRLAHPSKMRIVQLVL